jgi:uncharacterized membrane protein
MPFVFSTFGLSNAATLASWSHALEWIGRFHVLTVHFPIAMLLAAALAEAWFVFKRQSNPSPTVRFCVVIGALGAVVAAGLGWPHAALGGFSDNPSAALEWHRWLGTSAALAAVATVIVGEIDARHGLRSTLFRVMLFGLALMVSVAAHLGGLLTHGDDFLRW